MVIGQYQSKVAGSGRVSFPKKFRDDLGNKFVITQGYEGSLLIVPYESWESLVSTVVQKPFIMGLARDTARFLLGSATVVDLDEQGRFVIPPYLRNYGQISEEVVFLGLGSYIELWDLGKWREYQINLNKNSQDIAQKLSEIG